MAGLVCQSAPALAICRAGGATMSRTDTAQLAALPAFSRPVKTLSRLLASRAVDCALDVQGRILLPPALRQAMLERGIHVTQSYGSADLGSIAYESLAADGSVNPGMILDEGLLLDVDHRIAPRRNQRDVEVRQVGRAIAPTTRAAPGAGARVGIRSRGVGAVFIARAAFMGHDDRAVVRRQPVEVTVGDRDQQFARCPLISVFLPANGGLPMMASNPDSAPSKTSGNSSGQWNVT